MMMMMSKDDDDSDDEVDRCLRTETSRSDEEGTSATTEDGSILLAEEDEAGAEVILAAGRGRLRIIIAREKAEVVTTSFESVVVLPAGTTDADGTIDEKNTTNPLWTTERGNNLLHLYNTRFEKVSCDRFNRTDCSCV